MATNLVDSTSPAANEAGLRQVRLLEIVAKGLPPFPHTVLELTAILSGPSADVKKAAKLIRTDAALSAQLLRMCSSPMFGLRSRVVSIGQAATLLGADRLRTMVMTTSMVDVAGSGLPREESTRFWQHCFLAALLSEHLAKHTGYSESEQAYIAGLLHDIGEVPHWMLVCEERARKKAPPPENWFDNPPVERPHFGLDHCHIGGLMATGWNFMPSFIDVISNHHQPDQAEHDPYLAKIVGTVEHFLLTRVPPETENGSENGAENGVENGVPNDTQNDRKDGAEAAPPNGAQAAALASGSAEERTSQPCDDSEWQGIAEDLEAEYNRLLPVVAGGLTNVLSGAG